MSKKEYDKELRVLSLLNEKIQLYNNIRSTFTTYDAKNIPILHINEKWLIKKTLGQEFLDNFLTDNKNEESSSTN